MKLTKDKKKHGIGQQGKTKIRRVWHPGPLILEWNIFFFFENVNAKEEK